MPADSNDGHNIGAQKNLLSLRHTYIMNLQINNSEKTRLLTVYSCDQQKKPTKKALSGDDRRGITHLVRGIRCWRITKVNHYATKRRII